MEAHGAFRAGKKKEGPGTDCLCMHQFIWGLRFHNLSAQSDAIEVGVVWLWIHNYLDTQTKSPLSLHRL